MAKKFTTKKYLLRKRTAIRNQKLKIDAPLTGNTITLQESNRDVLLRLEAKAAK